MDKVDIKILQLLQRKGNLTNVELADSVALSATPCARRIKRLEKEGVIESYQVKLSRKKLGFGMTIFANIRLSNHREKSIEEFENKILNIDNIIHCHTVSGSFDYMLEVVAIDLPDYEKTIRRLQSMEMVHEINTNFSIREVKTDGMLPLTH